MAKPITDEELEQMKTKLQDTQALTGLSGAEQARLIMQDALPEAARSLVQLALYADKESVRMQSTIHILDRGLGRVQDNPPIPVEDPFMDLMSQCARQVTNPEEFPDLIEPTVVVPGELTQGRGEARIQEELLLDEITSKLRAVEAEYSSDEMLPPTSGAAGAYPSYTEQDSNDA